MRKLLIRTLSTVIDDIYKKEKEEKKEMLFKFKYAIVKISGQIKNEVEALKVVETNLKDILAPLNSLKENYIREHGIPDDKGNITIPVGTPEFTEMVSAFKKLEEEHVEDRNRFNSRAEEYQKILDEEIELDSPLYTVLTENIPQWLTLEQIEILEEAKIIKE